MEQTKLTTLGYALLGLINESPRSGYDLHRLFVTTPIGRFSGSPGAVYPALGRLKERGVIEGRDEGGAGARRREVYRLTPTGRSALKVWLREEISAGDVARREDVLLLRFGFMERLLGRDECAEFLERLAELLAAHVSALELFLSEHETTMPLHGRLAMRCGIMGYESQLRWAGIALEQVRVVGGVVETTR